MISGREALQRIEDAIATLRAQEARLDADLRHANEEAARLRGERMAGFRDLARVRLDTLTRDSVIGELDAAERRALALLGDRSGKLEALARRRREAEEAERRAEALRHEKAAAFEAALERLEAERARAVEAVRAGEAFRAAKSRADAARGIAEEAEKKRLQAEADREEKRRPYEADPLFMYLWERRFGTSDYRGRGLTRLLDRAVANFIGFTDARANYHLLNEIPARLAEHAAKVREEIAEADAALAATEAAQIAAQGLPGEAALRAAKAELDRAEDALAAAKSDLAARDDEHAAALSDADPAFAKAIDVLAAADARQDLAELFREAAATPTPEDEAALHRIEATEVAIGRAEAAIGESRNALREAAARRTALEKERDGFRRQGYDSPWGRFGNEDMIGNVLGGILGGVLSSTVLRDVLRDSFQRREGGFGGGFPFPIPGGDEGWGDPGRGGGDWWGDPRGGSGSGAGDLFGPDGPFGPGPRGGDDRDDGGFRTGGQF